MTEQLTELLEESRRRGFLGPGPVEDHLGHARAFAVVAGPAPARALDLGAGGGLPGLILAHERWPDCRWVFLDAMARRTEFLREAVAALGLAHRVEVRTARAEVAGRDALLRESHDLVVARSFGPPAVTLECAAPLLGVGGALVVSEPPSGSVVDRWPTDGLAELGCDPAEGATVDAVGGLDEVGSARHFVRITKAVTTSDRYPRRDGIPAKRPLF